MRLHTLVTIVTVLLVTEVLTQAVRLGNETTRRWTPLPVTTFIGHDDVLVALRLTVSPQLRPIGERERAVHAANTVLFISR
uniref:Putative secreted protein n=1 Tax=Anopheles triannulatus TaxID=58253 RepID=A0A2M4B602_9DIPT